MKPEFFDAFERQLSLLLDQVLVLIESYRELKRTRRARRRK
jgi:hypothetical protein